MNKVSIVMVDDDDDDHFMLQTACDEADVQVDIIRARCFEELAAILGGSEHLDRFLILMDLNLPRINGLESLAKLSSNDRLRGIPVFIFTTCSYEEAIRQAYANGAIHFITKPSSFEKLKLIVLRLGSFNVGEIRRPTPWGEFVLSF